MKQGTRSKTSRPSREKSTAHDDGFKDDVAAARRRVKERRKNRRRNIPVGNLIFVAATIVVSVSMLAGIKKRYSEYYFFRDQVVERRARLDSINKQYAAAEARLALVESNKGRAQLLVERGYVHPGERILLFPESEAHKAGAATESAGAPEAARATTVAPVAASRPATSRWARFWRTVRGLPPEGQPARTSTP